MNETLEYLKQVIKKLQPGGVASIYPFFDAKKIGEKLEAWLSGFQGITWKFTGQGNTCLEIHKNQN